MKLLAVAAPGMLQGMEPTKMVTRPMCCSDLSEVDMRETHCENDESIIRTRLGDSVCVSMMTPFSLCIRMAGYQF